MPRVVNFEGTQHTFPDDATDQEVQAALSGSAPAAPKQTSQSLGFEQGVGNFLANAAAPVIAGGKALGIDMSNFEQGSNIMRNPEHAPNEVPGKIGRFGADVMEGAPVAAMAPAGLGGTVAANALTGALTGDPNHPIESAALGAGGGALMHGVGKAIAPAISDAVQRLADKGVTMTPGQIFGGTVKGLEDRASGFWPFDTMIKGAQRQSLRDANTATGNIAMGGLGPIPEGISGQAMSTTGHKIFDDAYGQVLPQLDVQLDPAFANTVGNARDTVAARLPPEYSGQLDGTLGDVFKKMASGQSGPSNTFPGRAAKEAYSDLGSSAREYQSPMANPNDREYGRALGDVQEGIRGAFANSDPWAAGALNNIDTAYKNFIPVDNAIRSASGNAGGLEAGVPTGQQLRQAVIGSDNSVRKVASAQGGPALQQHAEDMIQVLPSSIGSSGSSERMGLLALPALGAMAMSHPVAAAGLAATPLIYSKPGLAAFNSLYAHGASPGATALGSIMQQLGRYGAGPAAGAMTGGGR